MRRPAGGGGKTRKPPGPDEDGPYRFYFYSHEPGEPPHVHVDRDEETCKFRLDPVALVRNLGFSAKELRRVQRLVTDNRQGLLEAWHEYFSE